ncbi:hypothetical protein J3R80_05690 [Aliiroseovarius sp. Z3]|nr:hypothetical protein [Aliiroseovarius sp. Z3]
MLAQPIRKRLVIDASSRVDALEYFGGLTGSWTGEHIQIGENWVYTRREPLALHVGIGT